MKNVLITGGNKGIGLSISKRLIEDGWHVISISRNRNDSIDGLTNFEELCADVSDENQCKDLFQNLANQKIDLDCIINNAGFSEWRSIQNIDHDFLSRMFAVNVFGYFYITKYGLPLMKQNGSILNISSLAAMRGTPNNSAYVATKFAVRGMTQSLSKELGTKGIRVNAINPVLISTEGLLSALQSHESPAKGNPEQFLNEFASSQTSTGRLPTSEDVADLACFLIGPSASAISGQSINVDCGVLPN